MYKRFSTSDLGIEEPDLTENVFPIIREVYDVFENYNANEMDLFDLKKGPMSGRIMEFWEIPFKGIVKFVHNYISGNHTQHSTHASVEFSFDFRGFSEEDQTPEHIINDIYSGLGLEITD